MLPRDAQMGDVRHVAQRLGMNEEGKIMPKVCENTSCFRERVYENIVYVKMSFSFPVSPLQECKVLKSRDYALLICGHSLPPPQYLNIRVHLVLY